MKKKKPSIFISEKKREISFFYKKSSMTSIRHVSYFYCFDEKKKNLKQTILGQLNSFLHHSIILYFSFQSTLAVRELANCENGKVKFKADVQKGEEGKKEKNDSKTAENESTTSSINIKKILFLLVGEWFIAPQQFSFLFFSEKLKEKKSFISFFFLLFKSRRRCASFLKYIYVYIKKIQ